MQKTKKFLAPFIVALLFASLIMSCDEKGQEMTESPATPAFDLATAKAEIEAANKEFMALLAAGDSVGLANYYTQDAKFMNAGAPAVSGRKNIQSAMSGIIQSGITKVDLRLNDAWGTGDLLVEEGELSLFAGDAEVAQEKYIVVWKKEDGKWKLFRDIFNSNLPPQ
ncbi:MAG: DUF4440 domain-containing protein [Lewinellaceae bacterium]|nr:DUF4440 domain-containing protein [Phaeodactylibacter sp.]MCB9040030.1 DUF4440 domain-containing protein [Lewinellaceae bacterium]